MKNEKYVNSPAARREIATILARAKMRLAERGIKSDNSSQVSCNQVDKLEEDGIVSQRQIYGGKQ